MGHLMPSSQEIITSIKIRGFSIFFVLDYEGGSEGKPWDFFSLLWPAVVACACPTCALRMQLRKKIRRNSYAFPLPQRKRAKIPRPSFVIVSMRMVSDMNRVSGTAHQILMSESRIHQSLRTDCNRLLPSLRFIWHITCLDVSSLALRNTSGKP